MNARRKFQKFVHICVCNVDTSSFALTAFFCLKIIKNKQKMTRKYFQKNYIFIALFFTFTKWIFFAAIIKTEFLAIISFRIDLMNEKNFIAPRCTMYKWCWILICLWKMFKLCWIFIYFVCFEHVKQSARTNKIRRRLLQFYQNKKPNDIIPGINYIYFIILKKRYKTSFCLVRKEKIKPMIKKTGEKWKRESRKKVQNQDLT